MVHYKEVLKKIRSLSNPEAVAGMARFGINPKNTYGVSIPVLRKMAKQIGKSHLLAEKLWNSGIHEARILAPLIDPPEMVTEKQMESWVKDFDSWDICDQCCSNLFGRKVPRKPRLVGGVKGHNTKRYYIAGKRRPAVGELHKTKFAHKKAIEWGKRREEFIKRTGFVLMAALAVHDKEAGDKEFLKFLHVIKRESTDDRNFVRKAVNWALRQIGKRNLSLNKSAIMTAKEIQKIDSKSARWIASDAIRELTSEAVKKKLS
jgi:3-methyladenine DNA glycosylase AlkD